MTHHVPDCLRRSLPGVTALLVLWPVCVQAAPQTFATPEDAVKALIQATQSKDRAAMEALFGPELKELCSGDQTQDAADFQEFAGRLAQKHNIAPQGDDMAILEIGPEGHPFSIPLVRKEGTWFFDAEAGKEELLNRRIGENELGAIRVCRGYVVAQMEYFSEDRDGDDVLEYAQRVMSSPRARDGLYWDTRPDEPPSPIGPAVAEARAEGYGATPGTPDRPRPYHGYIYRILTGQSAGAPGGAFDYIVNGNLLSGFALVAYPVEWGSSGIMSFQVNANGKVYQKDLGEKTADVAGQLKAYEIDSTWTVVED